MLPFEKGICYDFGFLIGKLSMGKIIAVANQKGGVAKTTTAINLSASLAVAGKKVLLIDLDPQGNTSSGMGIDRLAITGSIYDLLIGRKKFPELIRPSGIPRLEILPAQIDLVGAEVELVGMTNRENLLKEGLSEATRQYNFIVIDCPPSLGFLTLNALTAAHSLLVPLQCEYYAMEGLKLLLETMALVKKSLNPGLRVEGIVLTMFDSRNNLSNQVSEEIRSHFGTQVFKSIIPRNITLAEAPSHGKPALYYNALSRGAQAYLSLAREVLARNK